MSKRIRRTLYVVVGLIVALGLWAGTGYTINRGSGNVITVERPAADFDRIALSGSGKLIITQGNVEGVSIEAEDNIVDKLEAVVEDGVLRLRQNTPWWAGNLWPQKDIIFRVAVKNLKEVKVSGSAVVSCVGAIQGNELAVRCSGSARVDLAVKVERLVSTVSGSGTMTFTGTTNDLELRLQRLGPFPHQGPDRQQRPGEHHWVGPGGSERQQDVARQHHGQRHRGLPRQPRRSAQILRLRAGSPADAVNSSGFRWRVSVLRERGSPSQPGSMAALAALGVR